MISLSTKKIDIFVKLEEWYIDTFYGPDFFGPKCSEQILGSDLFWGRGGWYKRKEFLPQAVSSRSCDPLDIWLGDTFPPVDYWIPRELTGR